MAAAAQAERLPETEGIETDEDTLSPPSARTSDDELRTLLQPRPGILIRGNGGKSIGLGNQKVTCTASVSDAVIEDRG